ncbi:putative raffinose synthase protein Sip1 [Aspergillus lucknowensis]|uniref:Enoyl reductase (ER) domain-containing protein n=1 Tax=Aspergillus lucknowensis TaxID=176173 RepID=A0ABR4M2K3_9EURO
MAPSTQKQWTVLNGENSFDGLKYGDAPVPKVGENEVLVKLHAASLNYRDLIIPKGKYPFPLSFPVVPGSDGAGEVVEIGSKVSQFKRGDKVVTLFNQHHQYGAIDAAAAKSGLGGVIDGTLRQYGVFNENGVVRAPSNLDFLESSTLTCAGLTSWNALYGLKPLLPGQTVLVQGTGGVSIFALQFAKAAGATVIATTSSDEKGKKLKELGADHVINYKTQPNWGEVARSLTRDNVGVDHIIEVGGSGTLQQSFKCIKYEGIINIIGFLGGMDPKSIPGVLDALSHVCTLRGVYVGSKALMNDMVKAIEASNIHPVVDEKVFTLDKAREAYEYMKNTRLESMSVRVASYPPLGQVTRLKSKKINFTVILESESEQDWEVQVWHSIGSPEWIALSLQRQPPSSVPLLSAGQPQDLTVRFVFSEEIFLPHPDTTEFTIRYRENSASEWKQLNEEQGVRNGVLVSTAPDLTANLIRTPAEDFGKYFDSLSSYIEVNVRKSEAPGAALWQLSGSVDPARDGHSGIVTFPLGVPSSVSRFFALVRLSTPWLGPRQGNELDLREDAVLCSFHRTDGVHVVLLGVSGIDDVLTTLRSGSNGAVVIKSRNDNSTPAGFHVLAAAADEFEIAMSALIYEARKLVRPYDVTTNNDPKAQWLSSWYDELIYCTWNGIGQYLTEEKILSALDELKAQGIKISGLIIDDNWQSLDKEGANERARGWKQFEANPKAFPQGLAKTVATIRERHQNIEHIAVWHALLGYWGGISPEGQLAATYKTKEVKINSDTRSSLLAIDPDDIQRFYDDFYKFLWSAGITGVKADAQGFLDLMTDPEDRRRFTTAYQDAWSISSLRYFGPRVISCMSQLPQIIFHSQLPANKPTIVVRNSDDFFPDVEDSHAWHVFCNAHNALLTRYLNVLPDWDIFQTSHPYASFHAAARCVSGGPISITDTPGQHNINIINQLTAQTIQGNTVTLRPSLVGRTLDMYNDINDGQILRIGTYTGRARTGSGIIGLFNVSSSTKSSAILVDDFPGIYGSDSEQPTYIVRAHRTGKIAETLHSASVISVELKQKGWEILTAYPTHSFNLKDDIPTRVAVLGLLGKMTGVAALLGYDPHIQSNGWFRLDVNLKALGILGIYISDLQRWDIDENIMLLISGLPIPRKTVWKEEGKVLAIDVAQAWQEMGLEAGWSNELRLSVFLG